jgi:OOP family OmpA-OmpF porin
MYNDKFGIKGKLSYDYIHDFYASESNVFKLNYYQLGIEGVFNLFNLCEITEYVGRWGLLAHGGFQVSALQPLTDSNKNNLKANIGLLYGITPEYRISNRTSIFLDWSNTINFVQPYTWNGGDINNNSFKTGTLRTVSIGLSVSLGRARLHGDWYYIPSKKINKAEVDKFFEIEKRITTIEKKMKDGDKDGVPDYLDEEPNSLEGSYVDTKGRMMDRDSNGVPDYVQVYVENSNTENNIGGASGDAVMQMINNGFIAAYFYFSSTHPTNASTPNIGFLYRYLKQYPSSRVELTGYSDIIGTEKANCKLSQQRADAVKAMLVKAGIQSSRISTVAGSVDKSVDKYNSDLARRMMRRVSFKIK